MKALFSLVLMIVMFSLNGVIAQSSNPIPSKDCKPNCCTPKPSCCTKAVSTTTCTTAKDVSVCKTVTAKKEGNKEKETTPARKPDQAAKTEKVADKQEA